MAYKGNNLVDNIVDTQKKVMDSVVENTKKFTNGNNPIAETIEKGTDWYKNWLENQKNIFTKATGSEATGATEAPKHNDAASKANEFFENWMKTQADLAKKMWDMSQEAAKNLTNGTHTSTNPFAQWQNSFNTASNPMTAWMNNNTSNPMADWMKNMQTANFMNQMQNMNPFNADAFKKAGEQMTSMFNPEAFKNATDQMTSMFHQYYTALNNNMSSWQKNFENGTAHEAYKNMVASGEGFAKFTEMWAPMFKSIQDKTFNMESYKQWMNPELYKEFMDKFFGFLPESSREYLTNMTNMMKENMGKMSHSGMDSFHKMRSMMGNGSEVFGNVYGAYNNFNNMMAEAAAPFTKLMTPTQQSKTMQEWSDISKRITEYNIKNAELQYMIYSQGTKVMDKLAENVAKKIQDGVEIKSMLGLYQEWLNISDKVYVSLFESTEYSKLMGEVSAMQNRLRKDIELQMEKLMKDIPVATRSEMDEMYKTIYDLKKKVRQMEKMLDIEGEEEETPAPVAKKAAPAKKATASRKR
jgi:hypothetical protein